MVWGRFIGAAGLLAALLMSTSQALADATGSIAGYVRDRTTHRPIEGASVTALSSTGTYRAVADRDGFFCIVHAFPNAYVLVVSAPDYGTSRVGAGTVNAGQTTREDVRLDTSGFDGDSVASSNTLSIFDSAVPDDRYVLTAAAADATNGAGGAYGQYQIPSAVGTLPGVTLDAGVNAHVRGSRLDEVAYEYDGINAVDPLTGLAATDLLDDGIVRLQVDEDRAPSSVGATAASIDSVVDVGSYPSRGSITDLIQSPTYHHGISYQYGSATPDRRLSWFTSGLDWNSAIDWGSRGTFQPSVQSFETALNDGPLGDVSPSRDAVANIHFHPTHTDEIQALLSTGFQRWDSGLHAPYWPSTNPLYAPSSSPTPVRGLCDNNGFALFPGQQTCTSATGSFTDHVDQGFSIAKLELTHALRSSAVVSIRYARVQSAADEYIPFGVAPNADSWLNRRSDQRELGFGYEAQIDAKHLLSLSLEDDYSINDLIEGQVTSGTATVTPTASRDRMFGARDQWRPDDRLTIDLSMGAASRTFYRMLAPRFDDGGLRYGAGFALAVGSRDALRGSYASLASMPNVSSVEQIVTRAPAFSAIAPSNAADIIEASPDAGRTQRYDLSFEHSMGSTMALKVTPFWRTSTDLTIQYAADGAAPASVSRYVVQGIDWELQFLRVGNNVSGYINYTHIRALAPGTDDYDGAVGAGALRANALFPVSFIAPDEANAVLTWRIGRWSVNPEINYSVGYPYGVGRFTFNDLHCGAVSGPAGDPRRPCGAVVRNPLAYADTAGGNCGPGACTKLIDPADSRFADGRVCCSATTLNLNASYALTSKTTLGLQWQNVGRDYHPLALVQNPYVPNSPYGRPGFNGVLDYGSAPYIPGAIDSSEEFEFTVTQRL